MIRADSRTCASGDETGMETYIPPKILLLDDDPGFLTKISEGVEKAIFKLQTALDSSTGLLYACNEMYDAILINYEMLENADESNKFLEDIRNLPGYKNIPISVLLPEADDERKKDLKQQFSSVLVRSADIKEITQQLLSLISGSFDRYSALVVSPSSAVCEALGNRIKSGFKILSTDDPKETIELMYREDPDVVLIDHELENDAICRQIRLSARLQEDVIALFAENSSPLSEPDMADFVIDTREPDAKLVSILNNAASEYKDRLRTRNKDPLTSLPLRNKLLQYLIPRLHFRGNAEQKLEVVVFDIDSLKTINKESGFALGDEIIRRLGNYLQQTFSHQYVYSWGQDKFVIVSDAHDPNFGDKVRQAQTTFEKIKFDGVKQQVRLKVGTATYPQESKTATGLISIALDRLKEAPATGRR